MDDGQEFGERFKSGKNNTAKKHCTITTKPNSLRLTVEEDSNSRPLNIDELEDIFGFPKNYTEVLDLSNSQRLRVLGKSWSTQVIFKLLYFFSNYYQLNSELNNEEEVA